MHIIERLVLKQNTLHRLIPLIWGVVAGIFFANSVLLPFAPLPLAFLALKYGRSVLLLVGISIGTVLTLIVGPPHVIVMLCYGLGVGLVLSETARLKLSLLTFLMVGVVSTFVFLGIGFMASYGADFFQSIPSLITEQIQQLASTIKAHPESYPQYFKNEDVWNLFTNQPETIAASVWRILPGIIGGFALLLSWGSILLFKYGNASELRLLSPPSLNEWSTPGWFVWATVLGLVATVWGSGNFQIIGITILIIIATGYLVHGLAILNYWFTIRKIGSWVKVLLYGMVFIFFYPLAGVFVLLGVLDPLFHFRSRLNPPGEQREGGMS